MALEESIDGMDKLSSNGITAYIDPKLKEMLQGLGTITVNYIQQGLSGGYTLTVGDKSCSGGCEGC